MDLVQLLRQMARGHVMKVSKKLKAQVEQAIGIAEAQGADLEMLRQRYETLDAAHDKCRRSTPLTYAELERQRDQYLHERNELREQLEATRRGEKQVSD